MPKFDGTRTHPNRNDGPILFHASQRLLHIHIAFATKNCAASKDGLIMTLHEYGVGGSIHPRPGWFPVGTLNGFCERYQTLACLLVFLFIFFYIYLCYFPFRNMAQKRLEGMNGLHDSMNEDLGGGLHVRMRGPHTHPYTQASKRWHCWIDMV